MIVVRDVYKSYGGQKILDGVSFTVETGSISTIIGRSGGGKSVLLKHLIGLETPDSGDIVVDGTNIVGLKETELNAVRRRFGVLFQSGALFDYLTALENVEFPIREHTKLSAKEIRSKAMDRLATVGLADHGDKYPSQLSGGMRKRVALARALALDPAIVFFDEPTVGLDPLTRSEIYELVMRTHREYHATYIVVCHDIGGAFAFSDKMLLLWDGRIVAGGTPSELMNSHDRIVQQFISAAVPSNARPVVMERQLGTNG